jgi:hypothetical protein
MRRGLVLSLLSIFIFSAFFVLSLSSSSSLVYAANETNGTVTQNGTIIVTTNVPTSMLLDGYSVGYANFEPPTAPLIINNVLIGNHVLVVRSIYPGYNNITVYPSITYGGQILSYNFNLTLTTPTNQSTGSVWMWTPANYNDRNVIYSKKYLDGVYQGYGNVLVSNVATGIHTASAYYFGYYNYSTTINVSSGQMINVSLPLTQINTTINIYNCTDTDTLSLPSINYYTKGTATVMRNGQIDRQAADNCQSTTNLSEYYCQTRNSSQLSLVGYKCPYGCMNGICMRTATCVKGKPCLIPIDQEPILSSPPSNSGRTLGAVILIAAFCLLVLLLIKKKPGKKASKSIRITKKKKRI